MHALRVDLGMIVPLVRGRVSTEEVIVALVVHIPYKATRGFVQDNRDGCIVVRSVFVFPLNKLHRKALAICEFGLL